MPVGLKLIIVIILMILFAVSLALFFRRLLINSSAKVKYYEKLNEKLDNIIELLHKENSKK